MNTNALRQKILDLAIHGKLVKQDSADEPASVMLEKLRAEKEAKIAAGEIKRNKNDSYIFKYTGTSSENKTDDNPEGLEHNRHYEKFSDGRVKDIEDEIPFAVPEGWAWCRLGNYIDVRDGTHDSPKYVETGYPFVTSKNLINGKIDFSNVQYISEQDHKNYIQRSHVEDNDILFAMIGSIGNPVLIKKDREFSIKNVALFKAYEKEQTDMKFVLLFLLWIQEDLKKIAKGGMQPFIPLNLFRREIFIPLPPLSEQQRIVAKIETIFAQIDLLGQNQADLQTAVKQAKSKILDLAIRGKLVPQDPADEPASLMLERLRAEKEAKIAAGEMKRGKNDSYIYRNPTDNCYYQKYTDGCEENISDEIPFTVPEGWMWCRLGEISSELGDGIHGTPEYKQNGSCYFINGNNLSNGKIIIKEETKTVGEEQYRRYKKSLSSKTMFVSINGTLGSIAFYNNEHIILGKSVCYFNLVNERLKYFFYFLLNSQYFQKYAKEVATGSTIKNVSLKAMNSFLIPLPPLFEQQRIVTKIEELFAQLDFITTTLTK